MRPIYETITVLGVGPATPGGTGTVGAGVPHPVDARRSQFQIGIAVVLLAAATATWVTEYTLDNVWAAGYNPANGTWFPVTGMGGSASMSAVHSIPCTAIRCRLTAVTGLGVQLQLIQVGDGPA
jgi:hypothetical protein